MKQMNLNSELINKIKWFVSNIYKEFNCSERGFNSLNKNDYIDFA